jgi:hypothetical protein
MLQGKLKINFQWECSLCLISLWALSYNIRCRCNNIIQWFTFSRWTLNTTLCTLPSHVMGYGIFYSICSLFKFLVVTNLTPLATYGNSKYKKNGVWDFYHNATIFITLTTKLYIIVLKFRILWHLYTRCCCSENFALHICSTNIDQ